MGARGALVLKLHILDVADCPNYYITDLVHPTRVLRMNLNIAHYFYLVLISSDDDIHVHLGFS